MLRELQLELKKTLTIDAFVTVLQAKFAGREETDCSNEYFKSETVIFLLGKALSKVINSRNNNDWTRFCKLSLEIC